MRKKIYSSTNALSKAKKIKKAFMKMYEDAVADEVVPEIGEIVRADLDNYADPYEVICFFGLSESIDHYLADKDLDNLDIEDAFDDFINNAIHLVKPWDPYGEHEGVPLSHVSGWEYQSEDDEDDDYEDFESWRKRIGI